MIIAGDKDMTEHKISKVMSVELPRDLRMIIRLLFLCIHCLAHCVNLYLQDIAKDSKCIKEAFNFTMEAVQLKCSPKRQIIFEKIQKESKVIHQSQESALFAQLGGLCEQGQYKLFLVTVTVTTSWKK